MRRFWLFLVAATAFACSAPPAADQEHHLKEIVSLHFNNLNNDAELARIDARVARPHADTPASIGRQFSTYDWDPEGFILFDVECVHCRTKHHVVTYVGRAVLCSFCGSRERTGLPGGTPLVRAKLEPSQIAGEFKERYKPMFDRLGGDERPSEIVVIIRYIRRHWSQDTRGQIGTAALTRSRKDDHEKALKAATDSLALEANPAGGFHRLDGSFLAHTAFRYKGGTAQQIDRESVVKLLAAPESADRDAMRFGPALSVEEPIRPWNAPRTIDSPSLRAY